MRSWQEFVDVYSALIYDFCRSTSLQSSDSADVTQNVLLRVAKAIQHFEYDPSRGLFRDWLARIVLNEIRRLSSKRHDIAMDPIDLDQDAVLHRDWNEQFQNHIFQVALERSKARFSASTWEIFELSWIKKLSADEVAEQLGVGIEKVYVARSRVLKQLRSEVAMLADEFF